MTFLDLEATYGKPIPYDVSLLPVNRVDFYKDFGLVDLTGASLSDFKAKLEKD
jgi:hypothetical protein